MPGVGLNRIAGGKLFATTSGLIHAGDSPKRQSYNHFCDAQSAQLETSENGAIYASHNYWFNDASPLITGSNIVFDNKLGASDCSDTPVVNVQVERPFSSVPDAFHLRNQPNPLNGKHGHFLSPALSRPCRAHCTRYTRPPGRHIDT